MADLSAVVVSAPRLASSTDTVVARVVSASGADVSGLVFDMSIAGSSRQPDDNWQAATNTAGTVSAVAGPESPRGALDPGTHWVHLRTGDVVVLAGPFVITGVASSSELILDGGAP